MLGEERKTTIKKMSQFQLAEATLLRQENSVWSTERVVGGDVSAATCV